MENMERNATTQQGGGQEPEKTFTQGEVNKIVQDRLARERESIAKSFEKREAAIRDKEASWNARELLKKHNLPEHFLDIVKNAENQEEQVESILKGIQDYEREKNKTAPYEPQAGGGANLLTMEEQRRFGLLK